MALPSTVGVAATEGPAPDVEMAGMNFDLVASLCGVRGGELSVQAEKMRRVKINDMTCDAATSKNDAKGHVTFKNYKFRQEKIVLVRTRDRATSKAEFLSPSEIRLQQSRE